MRRERSIIAERKKYFTANHTKERKVCQKRNDIYGSGLKPQKRPTIVCSKREIVFQKNKVVIDKRVTYITVMKHFFLTLNAA